MLRHVARGEPLEPNAVLAPLAIQSARRTRSRNPVVAEEIRPPYTRRPYERLNQMHNNYIGEMQTGSLLSATKAGYIPFHSVTLHHRGISIDNAERELQSQGNAQARAIRNQITRTRIANSEERRRIRNEERREYEQRMELERRREPEQRRQPEQRREPQVRSASQRMAGSLRNLYRRVTGRGTRRRST
jgi:hypothetical protein